MPYCSQCGVEVEEYREECPLCSAPIQKLAAPVSPAESEWPQEEHDHTSRVFLSVREKRRRFMAFVVFLFVLSAMVTAISDYFTSGSLTWSLYPIAALTAAVLVSLAIYRLHKHYIRLGLSLLTIVGLLILVLDVLSGDLNWFLTLGLPIVVALFLFMVAGRLYYVQTRRRGFNLFAFFLGEIALFCLVLDLLIQVYLGQELRPAWAVIVNISIWPFALLFLFLHYGLQVKVEFRKIFHL